MKAPNNAELHNIAVLDMKKQLGRETKEKERVIKELEVIKLENYTL